MVAVICTHIVIELIGNNYKIQILEDLSNSIR